MLKNLFAIIGVVVVVQKVNSYLKEQKAIALATERH